MIEIPTMLKIKQASKKFGLAEHFVRQLCLTDKVIHIKAGNRYLINENSLITYLNTGEVERGCS